jgi:dihydroorotate dehydrogenase (NAD+) catalytic subunit
VITLSNGRKLEYVVASGALAFDGKGWPWEWPLIWLGIIKPELFTIFIKSLTLHPRKGNLRWWKPWACVRLIPGGAVNKVGLTNKGFDWWCKKVAPKLDFKKQAIAGSIFGTQEELVEMAIGLNDFDLAALEINPSCPNTGHALQTTETVIASVKAVKAVSRHPILVKLSVDQDFLAIARGLVYVAEGISLNSVLWEIVFPEKRSPLWRLQEKVGGGGGGVSGKPAQELNWRAVLLLAHQNALPVIAPSIMEYEDINTVRSYGAQALSFGTFFLRAPWKPTQLVRKDIECKTKL